MKKEYVKLKKELSLKKKINSFDLEPIILFLKEVAYQGKAKDLGFTDEELFQHLIQLKNQKLNLIKSENYKNENA